MLAAFSAVERAALVWVVALAFALAFLEEETVFFPPAEAVFTEGSAAGASGWVISLERLAFAEPPRERRGGVGVDGDGGADLAISDR